MSKFLSYQKYSCVHCGLERVYLQTFVRPQSNHVCSKIENLCVWTIYVPRLRNFERTAPLEPLFRPGNIALWSGLSCPSRTPTLILQDLARFLQMTLILQDLARFLQMTLILQDARSGRLSCKNLARSCKIAVGNRLGYQTE